MNKTCKKCGGILKEEGSHYSNYRSMTECDIDNFVRLKCSACGSNVNLGTIKTQGISNWKLMPTTGACFCPGCSHELNLDI